MIDDKTMYKLSYGLFVLTARDGEKDNGCIINTAIQVTNSPQRISIALNKDNFTHDMIKNTGEFNVSILSTDVPFDIFKHFGFQSGRDVDKFKDFENAERSENRIYRLKKYANSFISGKVIDSIDCGTHTLFVADVTEAEVLSDINSVTYEYYFANIKPKPELKTKDETGNGKIKGWVCKICGYVHEDPELPSDFICPICKHGAEDFEPIYE